MRCATVVLSAVALLAGCGEEPQRDLAWDLRQGLTMGAVDWPRPDLSAVELRDVASITLRLPEGRVLRADGAEVARVGLWRSGSDVRLLDVVSDELDRDAAYAMATRRARELRLRTDDLERWHDEALADPTATGLAAGGREAEIGDLHPDVEILHSFDDERPFVVSVTLAQEPGAAASKP